MAFQHWLVECLNKAGIDGEVYGDYIEGTLYTMKTSDGNKLKEALLEILEGYMVWCSHVDIVMRLSSCMYYGVMCKG